ncbi:MAG: sulfatase [Thermoanaerobaculia bacterium]|nr:sulfatase [Thermoanaerobaculia bacterium]
MALSMAACTTRTPLPSGKPPSTIVLFLVDTLRADRLGAYGYGVRPTSPYLDALAEEAVVFERASSPAPWTLPSLASIATSTHLCEHGVIDDTKMLPPNVEPLAARLSSIGYRTVGLYGNAYAGPSFGLDRGFDVYEFSRRNDGEKVNPVLDRFRGEPLFLYVHNMEPHGGERFGPSEFSEIPSVASELRSTLKRRFNGYRRLTRVDFVNQRALGTTNNTDLQRADLDFFSHHQTENDLLYDAAVRLADQRMGSVVDALKAANRWEDAVFVFLSDHGEELGEHGGWQHDQSIYEEQIHVPLVIRLPNRAFGGLRISSPVSLVDVLPTLAAVINRPELAVGSRGVSLLELLDDVESATGRPYVQAMRQNTKKYFAPWNETRGNTNIAIRRGRLKGIANIDLGQVELYDLEADPTETLDLSLGDKATADRFFETATRWLEQCEASRAQGDVESLVDSETRERLRALGYVD